MKYIGVDLVSTALSELTMEERRLGRRRFRGAARCSEASVEVDGTRTALGVLPRPKDSNLDRQRRLTDLVGGTVYVGARALRG